MFSPMEKGHYLVCDMKPFISIEILKELQRMSSNLRSNLDSTRRTETAKGSFHWALMEHV